MDWEAVKMGAVAINKINYKLKKSTMKETEKNELKVHDTYKRWYD